MQACSCHGVPVCVCVFACMHERLRVCGTEVKWTELRCVFAGPRALRL